MFSERTKQLFGTHHALAAIEGYLDRSSSLRQLVPEIIDPGDFNSLFWPVVKDRSTEDRESLVGFTRLRNEYGILSRIVETKLVFNLEATVGVLNGENYLVLAMCARSVIEHAASLIYLHRKATDGFASLSECKSLQDINNRVDGLLEFFDKFMYGTRFFGDENKKNLGLHKAIHINDMLRCGDERAPGMMRNYEFLCDMVHPNFLSNAIVFRPDTKTWSWEQDEEFQKGMTGLVLDTIDGTIRYLEFHTTDLFWSFLHNCDHSFRKFLQPKTKLDTLFRDSALSFAGDGTSKEQAIQFAAISMKDHFRMLERLIEEKHLGGAGIPMRAEEEKGFNYSVLKFPSCRLWFKIPKELEFYRKPNFAKI